MATYSVGKGKAKKRRKKQLLLKTIFPFFFFFGLEIFKCRPDYLFILAYRKKLTQVPPKRFSSTRATFTPNSAALLALAIPPLPPPITK